MMHPGEHMRADQDVVLKRQEVLLAEDDPISQEIVTEILKGVAGLNVTAVADGGEVLALCASGKFDLFILDLNLPTIKGNKLISYIRTSCKHNRDTPIILLSAHTMAELSRVKGAALASAIMSKPLDINAFSSQVRLSLRG
jgi:two-component system, sensor histidine kinase and response regulator